MKKFKSLSRAIKRGHVAVKFNELTKTPYLVRATSNTADPLKAKFPYQQA